MSSRMPRQYQESTSTRRSSRLKSKRDGEQTTAIEDQSSGQPKAKRRKLSDHPPSSNNLDEKSSVTPSRSESTSRALRRSLRITPSELVRRENALLLGERDLENRSDDLNQRILLYSKQQDEAERVLGQVAEREAQATLSQLEEYFNCPLCYEIMATPYTLNSGHCGHTFCALCILKWFFSRLHIACGGWHDAVDCPICRSVLIITPETTPRVMFTFPFVPNRTATNIVTSLVEKLSMPPANTAMKVKREEFDDVLVSGSKGNRERKCVRKEKAKEEEDQKLRTSDVAVWKEGGIMRTEWLKKDREGKREMAQLLNSWTTLRSQDFIQLKQKLGV